MCEPGEKYKVMNLRRAWYWKDMKKKKKIWKTISFLWCLIFDHAVAETEEGIEVEAESGEFDVRF